MNDVSALMDKLKSTISYKQFDAPPSADAYAWPVLEKMARVQSALPSVGAASEVSAVPSHTVSAAPAQTVVAAPVQAPVQTVVAAPAQAAGVSLFDRLQADGRSQKEGGEPAAGGGRFSRYAAAPTVDDAPQALSDIFERIGRKVR